MEFDNENYTDANWMVVGTGKKNEPPIKTLEREFEEEIGGPLPNGSLHQTTSCRGRKNWLWTSIHPKDVKITRFQPSKNKVDNTKDDKSNKIIAVCSSNNINDFIPILSKWKPSLMEGDQERIDTLGFVVVNRDDLQQNELFE
jgi:hypothetical protein